MGLPTSTQAKRLPPDTASFFRCLGFEGGRRNNLVYIASNTLIHTCGNSVQFLDLSNKSQFNLPSLGGDGVGCVAVHPSKALFAVCEKGSHPNVYIYMYPTLTVHKVLKQGTEKTYTAAAFNYDGSQLATVGGHPDYWLTVWDWANESIVLQSKAFSQDVFQVSFSRHFLGQLVTSGIGHIRFWKMANTFTGPKLEGLIGKFGQVPLSDICAFVELPDGKVLSGTESGTVLVWDGGLIKCQLKRPGGLACHDGMIEFIQLVEKENEMLTAGADGRVRFWSLQWLDAADDGDEKTVCEANPLRELQVDEKCSIKGIIVADDHWLIQDENGALWKVLVPSFEVEKVLEFHAGNITGLSASPNSYYLATSGSDCSVRLFHFKEQQQVYARWFASGATSIFWPPKIVDPQCRTVVAGFSDGVLRVLSKNSRQWRLIKVHKPHTMDVTALSYTSDGELLATSSLDSTVFFFHSSNDYKPLGFIKAPGPVTCIDWSPSGLNLLLGCSNGKVLEVPRPDYQIDSRITFELNLPTKLFTFLLPEIKEVTQNTALSTDTAEKGFSSGAGDELPEEKKPPSKKDDEEGRKPEGHLAGTELNQHENSQMRVSDQPQGGNSASQTKTDTQPAEATHAKSKASQSLSAEESALEKGSKMPVESGQTMSLDGQKMSQDGTRQSVHEVNPEESILAVRILLYTNSNLNTFYIALEGSAAGFLFECHIDMKEVMGVTQWHSKPVKCLKYSSSQEYIIAGHDDGIIRIQTSPTPGQLSVMQQHMYWEGRAHDGLSGAVSGAAISFDHQYLASAAYDGSFYIQELRFEKPRVQESQMLADKPDGGDEVKDIDVGVYSIEEDKQKSEQDNKLRIALQNRARLKEKVESICHSIADLLKENNDRDLNERLPLEDFEVDPNIRSMIEDEIQRNVMKVREELQWDSVKKSIALSKLQRLFLDPLEVEHIVLYAFQSGLTVTTFRTMKIDPELLAAINEANAQREKPPAPRVSVLTLLKDPEDLPKEKNLLQSDEDRFEEHHLKGEDSAALQDMRRLHLKKLVADYETYVDGKQNKKFENEDDIAAIKYAENNMGDFKLKSDLEHVRPINQQTNAKKKRNEMLLLKEAVYKQKMEFNREFLALRDLKRQICKHIHEKNGRIQEINNILRIKDEILYMPPTFKDETPEDRNFVTDKDIEEHCQNLKRIEETQKAQEKKGLDFGGISTKPKSDEKVASGKRQSLDESRRKEIDKLQRAYTSAQSKSFPLSGLEQEEQDAVQIKLKYQKSKLLEKIEHMIGSFDSALQELRHKRFQLEINIKRADLKMITLYQELKVLRTMQPKEEALESRHAAKLMEITEISVKISEQDKVLEQKKQELHALIEKKKQLMEEFEESLGENHPAKDALLKIYLRKVKLPKGIEDEEDDNLDENMDLDDSKGSEEDFDEDEVVEVCPPGCDQDLYQKVCRLRERRTIEDSLLQESNKQLDVLQREKESKLKKKKAMETALAGLEKETEDFQKEKQNALNQIDFVLTLYMHQLEHLTDGKLPEDLSETLVFSNAVINELKETIKDHGSESAALRKLQKELKKEHITLVRERKSRECKIRELEQRVTDVQMLKFGQMIDLEVLDTMSAKKDNEELKLELKTQEAQNAKEVAKWNRIIDDSIDQIARAMKEHTACLHVTADLQENIQLLNKTMKQKAGSPYRDVFVEKKKAELEYDHLCKVVTVQKQRMEQLKQDLKDIQKEKRKLFP